MGVGVGVGVELTEGEEQQQQQQREWWCGRADHWRRSVSSGMLKARRSLLCSRRKSCRLVTERGEGDR